MRKILLVAIFAASVAVARADIPGDYRAAMALYNQKAYAQAQEGFLKLAEAAPTPRSKSDCLALAASCLSRQKQYDAALALAQTIPLHPVAVAAQMDTMVENGKYKELIAAFKDEDIAAWPDYANHVAYYRRGTAYRQTGDLKAAAADLEDAVETSLTTERFRLFALNDLGAVYVALKEDEKALAAYRGAMSVTSQRGFYAHIDATLSAANILARQGKNDEALSTVKTLDAIGLSGNWKFLALQCTGNIYLNQGKKEEALAAYREALAVPGTAQGYLDALSKKEAGLSDSWRAADNK